MSKRTILLIIILGLITVALVVLAIVPGARNTLPQPGSQTKIEPTPLPAPKETILSFSPEVIEVNPTASASATTVEVLINTGSNKVTATQLEITYDPKVLLNVQVAAGTFFPNPMIFFNTIDNTNGKISYAIGASPTADAVSGKGTIATITFTPVKATSIISSPITLTTKSLVTAEGSVNNVLKETKSAVVVFSQK